MPHPTFNNGFLLISDSERLDLQKAMKVQPSFPPNPSMEYVLWHRILGPRSCWDEDFIEDICCDTPAISVSPCFDQTYTRLECCGDGQKRANNCAEKGVVLKYEDAQTGEDLSDVLKGCLEYNLLECNSNESLQIDLVMHGDSSL